MGELQVVVFHSFWPMRCFSTLQLWTFYRVVSLPHTPELEKHKYSRVPDIEFGYWLQLYFKFCLNYFWREKKWHSTVWFLFVILQKRAIKFSFNTAHALTKNLIKSRTIFKWCVSGGSTYNVLKVNVFILLKSIIMNYWWYFWKENWINHLY